MASVLFGADADISGTPFNGLSKGCLPMVRGWIDSGPGR